MVKLTNVSGSKENAIAETNSTDRTRRSNFFTTTPPYKRFINNTYIITILSKKIKCRYLHNGLREKIKALKSCISFILTKFFYRGRH